mgnify:CR=1 FL=1
MNIVPGLLLLIIGAFLTVVNLALSKPCSVCRGEGIRQVHLIAGLLSLFWSAESARDLIFRLVYP